MEGETRAREVSVTSGATSAAASAAYTLRMTLPTPFIGRERQIAQACALLGNEAVRLLTLTGPGGIGKTRLALAIAEALRNEFPDGVYYVSLAPLTDPTLVLPAIAQNLGVREAAVP